MTVILDARADIDLDTYERVAWSREAVRISAAAMRRVQACRDGFLELIDKDPSVVIYGVTTSMGEHANHRISQADRDRHARIKPFPAATSFGEALPERVVRGIVLARLANFIEGHAATSPRIVQAVADMLSGEAMPAISAEGQGGAGEILALYPLFAGLSLKFDLEVKERGSLINGSPCAAALLADVALATRRRLTVAHQTFALSIDAFGAPLEHYDAALDLLWGDPHEASSLQELRRYLQVAQTGRRQYQAPVSYRIVPRVLGHARRAAAAVERAAGVSLASVSDNPVYLPPEPQHPYGRCISTGGYHNAMASPALDDLTGTWADLCILADRHSAKLLNGRVSHLPDHLLVGREPCESDGHGNVGYIAMAAVGYSEAAKSAAQRTFIPGSDSCASAQDDVAAPAFLAWSKQERGARCLDASLATLAVLASQAFHVTNREPSPALADFLAWVRVHVPPVTADRVLGPELGSLAAAFTAAAFTAPPFSATGFS